MTSTLESFFRSIGLLWERLHIISADTVQTPGITCQWTQDLLPIGGRTVAAGEIVELRITLAHDHPFTDASKIRFDILKFDWLFSGGFDDPVSSLKTALADPPTGDFTLVERLLSEDEFSADRPTLHDVVEAYRIKHGDDYERGVLVVREPDQPDTGITEIITWWRAKHVADTDSTLYFVCELPGLRDSSTVALKVAAPQPGVNLRLYGQVLDTDPAAVADAQPVSGAVITLGRRTTHTSATGGFALDARVPVGSSTVTVTRPGIDARTLTVTVTERADHGFDVAVLDADAANAQLATGAVAADADDQSAFVAELNLRARVHRVSGTVSWPETRRAAGAPLTLAGRWVCAVPLGAGAALPQRPATSREWDALRARPDLLRSARPDRSVQHEATTDDGRFEISFVDLRAGSQYLIWVEGVDPRAAGAQAPDVIVRTAAALNMRRMAVDAHAFLTPEAQDRRVVDSTYNLLAADAAAATDLLRVVNAATVGAAADLKLLRPGRANPAGFDATPPADTEAIDVTDATMRADGLQLEVLPLVPVFEAAEDQSERARWATQALLGQLDTRYPRGHLLDGTRWVLDARRGPTANWNDAAACVALETTLLTHPLLAPANINNPAWGWWRADAVSVADYAHIIEPAGADFAGRTLADELVPVLVAPVPRLLGLFGRRHLHVSPGHGLYSQPPVGAANGIATFRPIWSGYSPQIENWAGEDENTIGIAIQLRRVAAANGVTITVSREAADPTRPGIAQNAAQGFDVADPAVDPDWPRLWQQNAYYWIAAEWDPQHVGNEIVLGHAVTSAAAQAINNAGINRRMTLFRTQAADPVQPVSAFVAIHTNAAAAGTRGLLAMYLDIRPNGGSPAPGAAGYVETNVVGSGFADQLATEVAAAAPLFSSRARSYWVIHPQISVLELYSTVTHFETGPGALDTRAAVAGPNLNPVIFPRPGGQDIPIGYTEVAFHSDPQDAANLAQAWFRFAIGVGIARAAETVIGQNPNAVTGDDVAALLRQTFGAVPEVTGLAGGANASAVADIVAAAQAVTGHAPAVASAMLGDVVSAIEAERDATTRTMLAQRVADVLAAAAGYTADAAQADDRARASLGPVLRALGAPPPAGGAIPAIGDLPRENKPPTRADAAAAIAGGLGLRPGTLATVTAPVNAVTVLPAAVPEAAEAFISEQTLNAAVTALGTLRPVDTYRLAAVRLIDWRGNPRPTPYTAAAGEDVYLAIDTLGTAWRAAAADITVLVARAGAPFATLACSTRAVDRLTTAAWTLALPGVAGPQRYDVSARIKHPTAGTQTIGPVPLMLTVAAP